MDNALGRVNIAAIVLGDGGSSAYTQWHYRLERALAHQTRSPDSVVTLTGESYAGAQDFSRSARSRLLPQDGTSKRVRNGQRAATFWRNVERELETGFSQQHQWLWIIPQGAVPAADALEKLEDRLFTVVDEATHPDIAIIGAKQWIDRSAAAAITGTAASTAADTDPGSVSGEYDPTYNDPELLNAGLYRSQRSEVFSHNSPLEHDQGQYDGVDQVPGVAAAGMLVRASLFDALGGFDPSLEADYTALDFCERAAERGAITVIVPDAHMLRSPDDAPAALHRWGGAIWLPPQQRSSQIRLRLRNTGAATSAVNWVLAWPVLVLRLLFLVIVKAPQAGVKQAAVSAAALLQVRAMKQMRSFRQAGRRRELVQPFGASAQVAVVNSAVDADELRVKRQRDITAESLTDSAPETTAAADAAPGDSSAIDNLAQPDALKRKRAPWALIVVVSVLTAGISLYAGRALLGYPALIGGSALPAADSFTESLHAALTVIAPDSFGAYGAADPFSFFLVVLAALTFGHASTVVLGVVVLAIPLSALSAWWASSTLTSVSWQRVLISAIWALAPVLQIATAQGRVGAVFAHILLPVVITCTVRSLRVRQRAGLKRAVRTGAHFSGTQYQGLGWQQAAIAALALAVVVAAAPLLMIPAFVAGVIAALILGVVGRPLIAMVMPSLAIFIPAVASAFSQGLNPLVVFFSQPGPAISALLASEPAPIWQQLLGFSRQFDAASGVASAGQPGSAFSWLPGFFADDFWALRVALLIGGPLVLVALVGVFSAMGRRRSVVLSLSVLGVVVYSMLSSEVGAGLVAGEVIATDPTPLVSLLVLLLVLAAFGALNQGDKDSTFGGLFAPVGGTLMTLSVIASFVLWAVPQISAQESQQIPVTAVHENTRLIEGSSTNTLPLTAADQGESAAQTRTLVISETDDALVAEVVSGSGKTLDAYRTVVATDQLPLLAGSSPEQSPNQPDVVSMPNSAGEQDEDTSQEDQGRGDSSQEDRGLAVENQVAQIVQQLSTSAGQDVSATMFDLGIGYIVIKDVNELTESARAVGGLQSIGETEFGWLFATEALSAQQIGFAPGTSGSATSWARIVDATGEPVALLAADNNEVAMDLSSIEWPADAASVVDPTQEYYLDLATRDGEQWQATLNGTALEPFGEHSTAAESPADTEQPPATDTWNMQFSIPGEALVDGGYVQVSHQNPGHTILLVGIGILFVLYLFVAVPVPHSWRLQSVKSRKTVNQEYLR